LNWGKPSFLPCFVLLFSNCERFLSFLSTIQVPFQDQKTLAWMKSTSFAERTSSLRTFAVSSCDSLESALLYFAALVSPIPRLSSSLLRGMQRLLVQPLFSIYLKSDSWGGVVPSANLWSRTFPRDTSHKYCSPCLFVCDVDAEWIQFKI
jgi:hypothetical protein